MRNRKITGLIALAVFAVMLFSGQGFAVDSSSLYHVSKWENEAASTTMYSVFSDYYYVNSSEYTWRKFNSNCFYFARWVTNKLRNVDFNLQCDGMRGIYLYGGHVKGVGSLSGKSVGEIARLLGQHLNDVNGLPTEQQVRNIFAQAQVGDVIQFVGWSSAGQHTMIIAQKYDNGFDTLEANNPYNTVRNNYLSYADFRNRIAAAGSRGGFSVYHFGTGPIPPVPPDDTICEGLRNLTPSRYAKVYTSDKYTDEKDRYNELYSDSELSSRLSGNYIANFEECRIIGVGRNSKGTIYAHIKFPLDNGRLKEGYVDLQKAFVPDLLNNGMKKTVAEGRNLHNRAVSGTKIHYAGIAAGYNTYLLAETNGWCAVLYETSARNVLRIVWMPAEDYGAMFNEVPKITSINNLPAQVVAGSSYRGTATATGKTPITWKTSSGTLPSSASYYRQGLPPGLSISGSGTTGTISGTPSHTSAGQSSFMPLYYFFNVTATNEGGDSAPKSSYIIVWEPPVLETSATLPRGDLNKYYSQKITAKGTEFSMTWKIIEGSLPPGLKFSSSKRTATISGTPTQAGYYRFKVQLYNLVGNPDTTTTRWYTITIGNVPPEYRDSNISFRYTLKNAPAGKSYSDWVGVYDNKSGSKTLSNYMFRVSEGQLPPGLYIEEQSSSSYSAGKVYLKGVPTTPGTYNFTLKAKRISDGGYNTKALTVKITSASVSQWRNYNMSTRYYFICTSTSPKLRVSYSDYIVVSGGSSPYTPSVVAGELPPGMTLSQSGTRTYLTGVPKRPGEFNFTVRITGSNGGYVDKACTVTVAENPLYKSGSATSASKPKFSSRLLPDAYEGSLWEATLDASGTEPIAWSAVDPLPEWLNLEEDTGRIYGIPMEKGKYRIRIKAENEIGSVTKTFKIKVVRASPAISTAELPEGYTGVPYETRLEATGTDPIKWSKIGKLPSGLKLNKTMGIISGTPRKEGSFDITIKAKNKAGTDMVQLRIVIKDSGNEISEKDEEEEPDDDEDDSGEESGDVTLPAVKSESTAESPAESLSESVPTSNGNGIAFTKLYALIGGEKLDGAVTAEAGKPLAFEIGRWVDEYGRNIEVSGAKIFVNDIPESADISDEGIFTLPGEIVNGEITVYALAQNGGREIKTLEVNVSAVEESSSSVSGSMSGNDSSQESSNGGCNFGLLGLAGMIFCGIVVFRRK